MARIPYKALGGHSGVRSYEPGDTFIRVWFEKDAGYEYDETRPGKHHIAKMKRLAEAGKGLSTYISRHVRENYARKL